MATVIGIAGLGLWNDPSMVAHARSWQTACVWIIAVSSLIGLCWYMLGLLMRSSSRSISFDDDGLWRTEVGKEQGLVRWIDIWRVKEGSSALSLFARDSRLMLVVEYERDGYFRIRTRIMEGMSFDPPKLPVDASAAGANVSGWIRLTFASATLVCLTLGVLSTSSPRSHALVPLFLGSAVVFGVLSIPRLRVTIGVNGVTIRRKTYPYASIRSIEASFLIINSRFIPKLTLDVGADKVETILTKGLAIDSLTLQRTMLWALARKEP